MKALRTLFLHLKPIFNPRPQVSLEQDPYALADFFSSRDPQKPSKAFCSGCQITLRAADPNELADIVMMHQSECNPAGMDFSPFYEQEAAREIMSGTDVFRAALDKAKIEASQVGWNEKAGQHFWKQYDSAIENLAISLKLAQENRIKAEKCRHLFNAWERASGK